MPTTKWDPKWCGRTIIDTTAGPRELTLSDGDRTCTLTVFSNDYEFYVWKSDGVPADGRNFADDKPKSTFEERAKALLGDAGEEAHDLFVDICRKLDSL